jgi:hypothetical protein
MNGSSISHGSTKDVQNFRSNEASHITVVARSDGDNLNNVRREAHRHFTNKKGGT